MPASLPVLLLAGALSTSGCDWVDSAGGGGNRPPVTEIAFDDQPAEGPIVLLERSSTRIIASAADEDGRVELWRWSSEPLASGTLSACAGVDGFAPDYIADSLEAACTSPGCALRFEQQSAGSEGEAVEFSLDVPILRAPVGVIHSLTAIDDDGGETSREYTFCLIAVNEAPTAVDDAFTLTAGTDLVVTAQGRNLLSNDADDIDVSNQPLSVLTEAVRLPAAAATFELGSDGGFVYRFAGTAPRTEIVDSFDYAITDGRFVSTATARIRITGESASPITLRRPLELTATVGLPFSSALQEHFAEPAAALSFALTAGSRLPTGFTLAADGLLAGTGIPAESGVHSMWLTVGDGRSAMARPFTLLLRENRPVEHRALPPFTGRVGEVLRAELGRCCRDPEGQPLAFRLGTAPRGHALAVDPRSGVLSGVFRHAGSYRIDLEVADGSSQPITLPVLLDIEAR